MRHIVDSSDLHGQCTIIVHMGRNSVHRFHIIYTSTTSIAGLGSLLRAVKEKIGSTGSAVTLYIEDR